MSFLVVISKWSHQLVVGRAGIPGAA